MAKKSTPQRPNKPAPRPQAAKPQAPKPKSPAPQRVTNNWWGFALAVLAITAACYSPSVQNKLVNWDDEPNITENPNIEKVGNGATWGETIANIFSIEKGAVIGNYNPLPILTFAIEKSVTGKIDTTLIHTVNLLLHLITVFFVFNLLIRMDFSRWGAFIGALLFGIHPMRVESVAWATERKDVLFAAFFFAALLLYIRWIKSEDQGQRTRLYLAMLALALLSCFSKVQAVSLPLSMLALDYWFRRPIKFNLIWEKAPFWVMSVTFGLLNIYTLKVQGSTDDTLTNFTFLDRLCVGMYSFCVYLYKLIIPYPMSPLYPYPKPLPIWVYLSPILFLGIWYLIWRAWKKEYRVWVFGVVFFFFNVMFVLQVFGAGQGFLADRFTYVPYFGLFAIAAWYWDRYVEPRPAQRTMWQAVLGVVALVYAIVTVMQINVWKNGDTLWSHVIKYEGRSNSLPYWNRGQYFRSEGKYDAALKDYTEAINIEPMKAELYNSRGKTYFDMAMSGKFKAQERDFITKALNEYTTGLSKKMDTPKVKAEILINRGAAYGATGNLDQAIKDLSEGIQINPKNKNGYFNRSIAYYNSNNFEKALADYEEYLKYEPYDVNILYESGMLLRSMNRNDEAIRNLGRALALNPKFGLAYLERARAYIQNGNKAAAQSDYQRAQQYGAKLDVKDQEMLQK